ncbi:MULTISPECIES: DUF2993 domain-containing protein [unclassified Microcella]|uniref:LmeA family phospholipid-binding protein n=1 Tax=unclassified Microcella TaxID=2630066 RepID=UPI0006FAA0DC|nr:MULTISPECIES: DUF2993 domain-containing protein [unclassified Microcella]KQV24727.1 hypothetical protein ASC54_09470 [Yonghaparkia sp. Root332]KRF31016.1 hypothetical protein ASG83_09300 [Yonghaparkia sp. Soil809]
MSASAPADRPVASRRRGGRRAVIIVGVTAALLGVLALAAIVADGAVRGVIRDEVADRVRTALELDPEHPVAVDIAGRSVLLQLASGRFERVDVDAGEISAGDLTGTLTMSATGIPVDSTRPTERVDARFVVQEGDIAAIAGALSGASIEEVALEGGQIRFRSTLDLLGIPLEVGVGLLPEAADGALTFTPASLVLGEEEIDLQRFAEQFGGLGDGLLSAQSVCVAEHLPSGLLLEKVDVEEDALVIALGADDVALDGPALSQRGTC